MTIHPSRRTLMASATLSLAIHLMLLAGFNPAVDAPPTARPGMPWISVRLGSLSESGLSASLTHNTSTRAPADKGPIDHDDIAHRLSDAGTVSLPPADANPAIPDGPARDESRSHHLARNHLQGLLQTRLSRYLVYPPLARSRGWEGTVLMGLRVEPDGNLERIHIARSSGYAVLDNSALNSLNRLGRLAEAATWLEGRGLDVQLPVIYQLIDN